VLYSKRGGDFERNGDRSAERSAGRKRYPQPRLARFHGTFIIRTSPTGTANRLLLSNRFG
jgi:hypothetical protein